MKVLLSSYRLSPAQLRDRGRMIGISLGVAAVAIANGLIGNDGSVRATDVRGWMREASFSIGAVAVGLFFFTAHQLLEHSISRRAAIFETWQGTVNLLLLAGGVAVLGAMDELLEMLPLPSVPLRVCTIAIGLGLVFSCGWWLRHLWKKPAGTS